MSVPLTTLHAATSSDFLLQELATVLRGLSPELCRHADRVSALSLDIVKYLAPCDRSLSVLTEQTARLHDLGKLALNLDILERNGPLTQQEYAHVQRHADIGSNLVLSIAPGHPVAFTIRHHHEWWNGRGYPDGIDGESIPLASRVIAVADAFDAMTSKRPYRDLLSVPSAISELQCCSGTQFDPEIVAAMVSVIVKQVHHE